VRKLAPFSNCPAPLSRGSSRAVHGAVPVWKLLCCFTLEALARPVVLDKTAGPRGGPETVTCMGRMAAGAPAHCCPPGGGAFPQLCVGAGLDLDLVHSFCHVK
jgi:hypothetical protein